MRAVHKCPQRSDATHVLVRVVRFHQHAAPESSHLLRKRKTKMLPLRFIVMRCRLSGLKATSGTYPVGGPTVIRCRGPLPLGASGSHRSISLFIPEVANFRPSELNATQ